jgi:hypothetical protein
MLDIVKGSGRGRAWRRVAASVLAIAAVATPAQLAAQSQNVRVTKLTDVTFGGLTNLGVDASLSQDICVYANTTGNRYRVTATGSGPAGSFALSSGANLLPYEVQWNAASGQSSGLQLVANSAQTGLISTATQQTCNSGPLTSASLILLLRSTALSSAMAGTYSGTLTLLIGAD